MFRLSEDCKLPQGVTERVNGVCSGLANCPECIPCLCYTYPGYNGWMDGFFLPHFHDLSPSIKVDQYMNRTVQQLGYSFNTLPP